MFDLHRRSTKKHSREWRQYAKPSEISSYFREHRDSLLWIALAITGRENLAESAISAVSESPTHGRSVFLEWIGPWAQYESVRSAVALIKEDIARTAVEYEVPPFEMEELPGLSETETRSLKQIDARTISTELDPLARSVLILNTLRNTSTYDCAVALGVPSAAVFAARCRALIWLRARQIPEPGCIANSAGE